MLICQFSTETEKTEKFSLLTNFYIIDYIMTCFVKINSSVSKHLISLKHVTLTLPLHHTNNNNLSFFIGHSIIGKAVMSVICLILSNISNIIFIIFFTLYLCGPYLFSTLQHYKMIKKYITLTLLMKILINHVTVYSCVAVNIGKHAI